MPTAPDKLQHQKWCLIADKIQSDPALLDIPLANIRRWSKTRRSGIDVLNHWRRLIEGAQRETLRLSQLLDLLRSDDEKSRQLKSYSPFPGILSTEEVDQFTWSWRH